MGPGLTLLDGYQRTNAIQNQEGMQEMQRASSGLALVDKIRQAQTAAARQRAFQTHGNDMGALSSELLRMGDTKGAEEVDKMRREREFETEMQGALSPDGTIDWNKVQVGALKRGKEGPALTAAYRADTAAAKRKQDQDERGALKYMLGDPEKPAEEFGGGLPEEAGGMGAPKPAPARRGALAEYEASDNPAVARFARTIREQVQAGALSAKEASAQLRALAGGDVRSVIEADKEEGRNTRSEARMEEMTHWDSKRGVGMTRGGQVVLPKDLPGLPASGTGAGGGEPKAMQYARWRVKTLVESGIPLKDAQRMVAGGASMNITPSTIAGLASRLMALKKDDLVTPVYPSLGHAMQAAQEALGEMRPRQGALPAAPDALPGSFSGGASPSGGAITPSAPPSAAPPKQAKRIRYNERGELVQ